MGGFATETRSLTRPYYYMPCETPSLRNASRGRDKRALPRPASGVTVRHDLRSEPQACLPEAGLPTGGRVSSATHLPPARKTTAVAVRGATLRVHKDDGVRMTDPNQRKRFERAGDAAVWEKFLFSSTTRPHRDAHT